MSVTAEAPASDAARAMAIVVKTEGDPLQAVGPVRAVAHTMNRHLPLADVQTPIPETENAFPMLEEAHSLLVKASPAARSSTDREPPPPPPSPAPRRADS